MEPAMWKAINLQLITFPLDPQACLTANWWENLTGLNEYESSKKRLERTDDGQYLNFGLKLEMDLLRVSWTRGPIASDVLTGVINDDAADGMRNLGEFNGASHHASMVGDRVSANLPYVICWPSYVETREQGGGLHKAR
jgi:hypothetical protein